MVGFGGGLKFPFSSKFSKGVEFGIFFPFIEKKIGLKNWGVLRLKLKSNQQEILLNDLPTKYLLYIGNIYQTLPPYKITMVNEATNR